MALLYCHELLALDGCHETTPHFLKHWHLQLLSFESITNWSQKNYLIKLYSCVIFGLRLCGTVKAIIFKHTFEAEILIDLWPMDTSVRKVKVSALGIGGVSQPRPIGKGIAGAEAISGLCINMGVINPHLCYIQLLYHIRK